MATLQDCPNQCGRQHYGPPTASNCPRFRAGGSGRAAGSLASGSALATKSILSTGTASSDRGDELDRDLPMDELLETDMGAIEITGDQQVYRSGDSPIEQGSIGDCDDYISSLTRGHDGWKAVSGLSRQQGNDGPLMHSSEVIGDDLDRHIRANPGKYAVVSVTNEDLDEDGDVVDTYDLGWMLVKKETDNSGYRGVGGYSDPVRRDITLDSARDAFASMEPTVLPIDGDSGTERLSKVRHLIEDSIPNNVADGDTEALNRNGRWAIDLLDEHANQMADSRNRLRGDPDFRELRGGATGTRRFRLEHNLNKKYGTLQPSKFADRFHEITMTRDNLAKALTVQQDVLRNRQMNRNSRS